MIAPILSLALVAFGINAGWEASSEGGTEYIIQLDAQSLEALKNGSPLQSDVPRKAGEVRSFRLVVNNAPLPQEDLSVKKAKDDTQKESASSETTDEKKAGSLLTPPTLDQTKPSNAKPLPADPAVYQQTDSSAKTPTEATQEKSKPSSELANEKPGAETAKPWLPLTLVTFGFFLSLGGNVYLGWLFAELRKRYREAIA